MTINDKQSVGMRVGDETQESRVCQLLTHSSWRIRRRLGEGPQGASKNEEEEGKKRTCNGEHREERRATGSKGKGGAWRGVEEQGEGSGGTREGVSRASNDSACLDRKPFMHWATRKIPREGHQVKSQLPQGQASSFTRGPSTVALSPVPQLVT